MAENIYSGPAKVYKGTTVLWPDKEDGAVALKVDQEAVDFGSGFHGRLGAQQGNNIVTLDFEPFSNWSALGLLYPAYLGVTVGATAGAFTKGTRPHGALNADVASKVWTWDQRLYTVKRSAVIKHPDLHLGIGKGLYGAAQIVGILASGKKLGDASAFYDLASGAADPGGQMTVADFESGAWTGAWGATAGWGGDGGDPIEAEEEWVISSLVKYSPLPVQRLVRAYQLESVSFMAKTRPYGPTQVQIDSAIGVNAGRTLGSRVATTNGADLVLTGPGGKTITLKNCEPFGAGFDFGGKKLGNGEVGFVSSTLFTAGVPGAFLVFSA